MLHGKGRQITSGASPESRSPPAEPTRPRAAEGNWSWPLATVVSAASWGRVAGSLLKPRTVEGWLRQVPCPCWRCDTSAPLVGCWASPSGMVR
jgi:hypothetical protein